MARLSDKAIACLGARRLHRAKFGLARSRGQSYDRNAKEDDKLVTRLHWYRRGMASAAYLER
jgi:hypothetical protein